MKKKAAADEKKSNSANGSGSGNGNGNGNRPVDENENEHVDTERQRGEEADSPNENTSGFDRTTNNTSDGRNENSTRRRRPPPSLIGANISPSNTSNVMRRRRRDGDGGKQVYGGGKAATLSSSASRDTMSTASITVGSTGTSALGSVGGIGMGYGRPPSQRYGRRNIRRSRNMFNRQLQLLLSVSGSSVILFLFFFLNIFAFTALMTGFASTVMFAYTFYEYVTFVLSQGEGALYDYLPSSVQEYLANTSLHDAMTSNDGYMENRWYLLYFIPGLTPDQVNAMVRRLPQRHRDMAYGPGGLARLLPDNYYRLIAPPGGRSQGAHGGSDSMQPSRPALTETESNNQINGHGYDNGYAHIHDPSLPVIIEHDEEEEELEGEEVTMQDAFHGLLHTARALVTGTSNEQQLGLSGELESDVSYDDDNDEDDVGVHRDISWDDSRSSRMLRVGESADTDTDGLVSESQTSLTRSRVGHSSSGEGYPYHDMSWETQGSQFDIDDEHDDVIHHNENVRVELTVDLEHDDEDDDASMDIGLDIAEDDFVGGMNDGQLQRLARLIRLPFRNNRDTGEEEGETSATAPTNASGLAPTETPTVTTALNTEPLDSVRTSTATSLRETLIPPDRRPSTATNRGQSRGSNADNSLPSTVMTRRVEPIRMQPLSSLLPRVEGHDDEEQTLQTLEEQQEIEGDILNEAISTMVNNYTNSTRNAALDVVRNLVERIAPLAIRFGVRLSSISSVGLLGLYSSTQIMPPIHMAGRNIGGGSRSLTGTHSRAERYIITGLTSSIVLGAFSVGSAYIARSYVRRAAAASRENEDEHQGIHVENKRKDETDSTSMKKYARNKK